MSVAFDTLKFAERLEAGGFSQQQAKAAAQAFADATGEQLATKNDAAALSTKLDLCATRSDLREVESRLETKIESIKSDILKWVSGTIGFQTVAILGTVLALSRFGH